MTREKYYAVRIGDLKKHIPYFMTRDDSSFTPWLFQTRAEAEQYLPKQPSTKVVIVWLQTSR